MNCAHLLCTVIIQMGSNISHILDKPYLEARHHKSQLHFVPPSGLPQAKGSIRKLKANASPQFSGCSPFAPDDGCPQIGMQMTLNTLVGLGITFTLNAGLWTRCERHIDGMFRHDKLTSQLQVTHMI